MSFLYPGEYIDSTYSIDFDKLYKEGYRGIIFDIDNTLVTHGSPADERAIALFEHLKELEKQGIAKVLRPSEHIKISKIEKDPNKLESLYQLGLRDAKRLLADKQGMEKQ